MLYFELCHHRCVIQGESLARGPYLIQGESLARGPKLLSMYTVEQRGLYLANAPGLCICCVLTALIQGESLARGPKLLSMYIVEQRGFLVRKYCQTGSFKACQTAFRTEFGERRAPSKCCVQKLVRDKGKPI